MRPFCCSDLVAFTGWVTTAAYSGGFASIRTVLTAIDPTILRDALAGRHDAMTA